MNLNMILRMTVCVLVGMALGSMFVLLMGLVWQKNTDEQNERGEGELELLSLYGAEDSLHTINGGDITVKDEDLLWDGTLTDNVLKVEVTDPWLVFREIPDPLMTYDIDKKRWTFSDSFLKDVANALVPVLKERGFRTYPQE